MLRQRVLRLTADVHRRRAKRWEPLSSSRACPGRNRRDRTTRDGQPLNPTEFGDQDGLGADIDRLKKISQEVFRRMTEGPG